ncbi:glutamate--tRNA ligase [Aeoliella sp.]|uniref:glutamate--tRNA ligase n=1 Tax=Aeoliella sp. TaxID=2795800 RepID=UPI003CCC02B8
MSVRTRFAPSPTGYLHIGGVRTALFNWLLSRGAGGQFLLRIDDTDQQRNVEAALEPILHGFRWLGLDWDEGPGVDGPYAPYFQSQRGDRYQAAVDQLLATGAAYRDYATTDELTAEREAAQAAGEQFRYSRKWMAETPEQAAAFEAEGRQGVVRLKMPTEGTLELNDMVRGTVKFDWAREQDHVVQRADGSCLYHLATVVDDNDFKITHVVRAEEHLSNTPRQVFIAQALGYQLPEFAHVPFVAEPGSKNKLSKRKLEKYLKNRDFAALNNKGQQIAERLGLETAAETFNPVIVDFYEEVGFLPDVILNYLVLLGWSLDDSTEEFTREEMIRHFSLERVNKAPASFDAQKLMAFQQRAMNALPIKQKVARCVDFLKRAGLVSDPPPCEVADYVKQIVEAAGDRITVFGDILDFDDFFTADDQLVYDEKAFEKRLVKPDDAGELLAAFREKLAAAEEFDAESLDKLLHDFVEQREIKIGQIIHAVRVAATGKAVGFGMFETLAILGKERSLARIDRALDQLAAAK